MANHGVSARGYGSIAAATGADMCFKIDTNRFYARLKIRRRRKDTYLLELVRYIHLNPLCENGYDFETVVERVSKLLDLNPVQVVTSSKNRRAVEARSLVCFWA